MLVSGISINNKAAAPHNSIKKTPQPVTAPNYAPLQAGHFASVISFCGKYTDTGNSARAIKIVPKGLIEYIEAWRDKKGIKGKTHYNPVIPKNGELKNETAIKTLHMFEEYCKDGSEENNALCYALLGAYVLTTCEFVQNVTTFLESKGGASDKESFEYMKEIADDAMDKLLEIESKEGDEGIALFDAMEVYVNLMEACLTSKHSKGLMEFLVMQLDYNFDKIKDSVLDDMHNNTIPKISSEGGIVQVLD